SRPIHYPYDLAFAVDFQNAARDGITHVDKMVTSDEEAVGMPQFPFTEKTPAQIEKLDACILAVTDVHHIAINYDGVRCIKLSRTGSLHSPSQQEIAIFVELEDSRIALAIG